MKNFKRLLFLVTLLMFYGCSKESVNPSETINQEFQITTSGQNFIPSTLNCNVGDTVYFDLGSGHNAVEVSEANYNANSSSPIANGFSIGYGESGYIVVNESKTYYYVCTPHLPGMKGIIVVE